MSSLGIGAGIAGQLTSQAATQGANNLAPLPTTDSAGLYSQGNSKAVITDFKIRHYYERDFHRYMMGVTSTVSNSPPVAFVQLAGTTLLWIADWTGSQFLQKAVIPDPTAVNPGWVLLDAWLEPFMVVLSPNGTTPLYRVSGIYVYGHTNPGNAVYDNSSYPLAPWITDREGGNGIDGQLMRTIDANDLQKYLLEPQQAITGQISPTLPSGPSPISKP